MCNKEKFWKALCRSIERPELVSDPRFIDFPFRFENRDELTTVLDEALGVKTTAEWLLIFGGAVPASPVLSVSQALESDFVKGNDRIVTVQNSGGQQVKLLRNPIKSSKPMSPVVMAPTLGQHTEELLIKAGLSHEEIAALRASRIV
jgi:crotonobetainyl-CoA:carnitine CoA-transferase CaiB-like acyl-CoA transferase